MVASKKPNPAAAKKTAQEGAAAKAPAKSAAAKQRGAEERRCQVIRAGKPGRQGAGHESSGRNERRGQRPHEVTGDGDRRQDGATKSTAEDPATKAPARRAPRRPRRPRPPAAGRQAKPAPPRRDAEAAVARHAGVAVELSPRPPRDPRTRGTSKDGIAYTKDFDVKFLKAQRDELIARRQSELARATRLEDEATSLIEDGEMGDVQFDDEGGEGDTMVVQRDLDRVLSTQARQTIEDIDAALERIKLGTYGYSEVSGLPIPASGSRRCRRPRCSPPRRSAASACAELAGPVHDHDSRPSVAGADPDRARRRRARPAHEALGAQRAVDGRIIEVVWTLQFNLAFNSGMAFGRGQGLRARTSPWSPPSSSCGCWSRLRSGGTRLGHVRHGLPDRWRCRQPDRPACSAATRGSGLGRRLHRLPVVPDLQHRRHRRQRRCGRADPQQHPGEPVARSRRREVRRTR